MDTFSRFEPLRKLVLPPEFQEALTRKPPDVLNGLVYRVVPPDDRPPNIAWALRCIRSAAQPPPIELVPLMPVDERSFACVVCQQSGYPEPENYGKVVRWHLDEVPQWAQAQLLDVSVHKYLEAVASDLDAREEGLATIEKIAEEFNESHGQGPKRKIPRYFEERPIRLAVQNVIIGLAAFRYDSKYDALSVSAWQTCEVPHLAAHEGTRGLSALILCEAYRCGSTMEIRFDRHPERAVPAMLKQFARTRDIEIGADDKVSITPSESRQLILAIPQIPKTLREILNKICKAGLISPERVCFSILSGIWSPVALEFMLTSELAIALRILEGGSPPIAWPEYRSELALARRALLVEKFVARSFLQEQESSRSNIIAFEDNQSRFKWEITRNLSVQVHATEDINVPWLIQHRALRDVDVFPCDFIDPDECKSFEAKLTGRFALILVPQDIPMPTLETRLVGVARAPLTLEAIDNEVNLRLLKLKVMRK